MTTTIDTSNGIIVLNGGGTVLPTSATSVTNAAGMIRYNSTNDSIEWYGGTGGNAQWYPVSGPIFNNTQTITGVTTLTAASVGNFIICDNVTSFTVTVPQVSALRESAGITLYAKSSKITVAAHAGDTVLGVASFILPQGEHLTIIPDGGTNWNSVSHYNPLATTTPYVMESVGATVSAAGTILSNATLIAAKHNRVSTVAAGTGVRLPALNVSFAVGVEINIINDGANALNVYPQSGAAIDTLSTNAPFIVPVGGRVRFIQITATLWRSYVALGILNNNLILSNISGISAAPIGNTLTALIDNIMGNAEGSILYRGAGIWTTLLPGTANQFLQTHGAGATPQWSNAVTSVATGTGLTGGTINTTGTISLSPIGDSTFLGNVSGSSTAPTATTISNFIDHAISSTQGVILYRGASNWSALAVGTSGQVLQTQGASADPQWSSTVPTPSVGDSSTTIATTAFAAGLVGGNSTVNTTGGSTTLTAAQYGVGVILVTGSLSTDATLVVPNSGKWTVSNRTTGAHTVTIKTLAGTGVIVTQGTNDTVIADGTNCVFGNTDYQTITLSGAVAGSGTTSISTTLASVSNNTVLSNVSGISAAPSANTLTAIIDSAIGNTQGDVLYRGASNWSVLAPGTSGQFLQTQGAASNPQWATALVPNSRVTELIFFGTNTGAAAGRLTTDGLAASGTNTGALAFNSAQLFYVEILAYDVTSGKAATWTLSDGLMTVAGSAATTTLAGSPTFTAGTASSGAPSFSTQPTIAADTTNGGYDIEFTPPSANTDTWHITARMKISIAS